MMQLNPQKRMLSYSILSDYRSALMGVAMLWIMLYHAFPLVIPVHIIDAAKRFGYAGVDIFIFLSGMGLTVSYLRKRRPYGAFLARRAARILPSFYLVTVPFYVWKLMTGRITLKSVLFNLAMLGYWLNTPDHFNWYIPALLVFYLMTPPIILALSKSGKARNAVTVFAVVAGVALCEGLMRLGLSHLLDFFYRIPIFWIGVRIGFAVFAETPLTLPRFLFWALLLALGAGYIYFRQFSAVYLSPVYGFILTTVPLCLLLALILKLLRLKPLVRILDEIGRSSLEIYLINASWFIEFDFFSGLLRVRPAVYCLIGIPVNLLLGIALHHATEAIKRNKANAH